MTSDYENDDDDDDYDDYDVDDDDSGLTSTEIDDRLSPGNVSLLAGETALLACKIYNLGNKSVSRYQDH